MDFSKVYSDLGTFVTLLVKAVVDVKESVSCKVLSGEDNAVVEIKVDPSDYGILIGREGATINALTKVVMTTFRTKYKYVKLQVLGAKTRLEELKNQGKY